MTVLVAEPALLPPSGPARPECGIRDYPAKGEETSVTAPASKD